MTNVKNLNSDNVKVFPVAKERDSILPDVVMSRLLTEFNISNIIRQIIGSSQGFVIGASKSDDNIIDARFNLYGYYFDIKYDALDTFGEDVDVYATLVYDTSYDELKQDNDHKYEGLEVTTITKGETPSFSGAHSIRLFSYRSNTVSGKVVITDGSVTVHQEDKFMFATEALPIGGIDGKPKQ